MTSDFPDDVDGDALRRVAEDGSDLSKPMEVDFFVAVPDLESGEKIASRASRVGYRTEVGQDEEDGSWTCYCSKSMLLSHDAVIAAQEELDELAAEHGGETDGWGTFGNAEES